MTSTRTTWFCVNCHDLNTSTIKRKIGTKWKNLTDLPKVLFTTITKFYSNIITDSARIPQYFVYNSGKIHNYKKLLCSLHHSRYLFTLIYSVFNFYLYFFYLNIWCKYISNKGHQLSTLPCSFLFLNNTKFYQNHNPYAFCSRINLSNRLISASQKMWINRSHDQIHNFKDLSVNVA